MQCACNPYAAIPPQSQNGLTPSCFISSSSLGSCSPLTSSAQSPSTTQDSNCAKQARRREQNRRSQRAYRHRKEKQLKILEDEIAQLEAKHQSLLKSYSSQSSEIAKLKSEIEKISNTITALQTASLTKSPDDFDFGPRFDSIIKGET
jgi:AP-1-like transcription factor